MRDPGHVCLKELETVLGRFVSVFIVSIRLFTKHSSEVEATFGE